MQSKNAPAARYNTWDIGGVTQKYIAGSVVNRRPVNE